MVPGTLTHSRSAAVGDGAVRSAANASAIVLAHNQVNRLRLCALFCWPMREYRARLAQDPAGYNLIGFGGTTPVVRRVNAAPG